MLGNGVAVGSCVGSEQGSAQQGRYGGMHTHVPQQQLHSLPTGQSCASGLHSLTVEIGVGVVATCVADADNARLSAVTSTHVARSVSIREYDSTATGLPIARARSGAAPQAKHAPGTQSVICFADYTTDRLRRCYLRRSSDAGALAAALNAVLRDLPAARRSIPPATLSDTNDGGFCRDNGDPPTVVACTTGLAPPNEVAWNLW